MKGEQLFPKPKRTFRMKQPRKNDIRHRMELAEAKVAYLETPWWWPAWHRISNRLRRERA